MPVLPSGVWEEHYVHSSFLQVKLSQPDQIHVKESNGVFKLNWSKPVVSENIKFSIQLKISTNKVR